MHLFLEKKKQDTLAGKAKGENSVSQRQDCTDHASGDEATAAPDRGALNSQRDSRNGQSQPVAATRSARQDCLRLKPATNKNTRPTDMESDNADEDNIVTRELYVAIAPDGQRGVKMSVEEMDQCRRIHNTEDSCSVYVKRNKSYSNSMNSRSSNCKTLCDVVKVNGELACYYGLTDCDFPDNLLKGFEQKASSRGARTRGQSATEQNLLKDGTFMISDTPFMPVK